MHEIPWGAIATVAGLILMAAAVWATRKFGNRHGALAIDARNFKLVPIRLRQPDGTVEVIEPNPPIQYSVELRLRNTGPIDITEAAFGGKPLVINLRADVGGLQASNVIPGFLETDSRRVKLRPKQIPKGSSWHWNIRCLDEEPFVSVSSPITDVKIRLRIHRSGVDSGQSIMGIWTFRGSNAWIRRRVHRY